MGTSGKGGRWGANRARAQVGSRDAEEELKGCRHGQEPPGYPRMSSFQNRGYKAAPCRKDHEITGPCWCVPARARAAWRDLRVSSECEQPEVLHTFHRHNRLTGLAGAVGPASLLP